MAALDLCLIPPCSSSLKPHIDRANYQTLIWKTAHLPHHIIPNLVGRGGSSGTGLDITWTNGDILPQDLADILSETQLEILRMRNALNLKVLLMLFLKRGVSGCALVQIILTYFYGIKFLDQSYTTLPKYHVLI